jgi:hypothetical protein
MGAYFGCSMGELASIDLDRIKAELGRKYARDFVEAKTDQDKAWDTQLRALQEAAKMCFAERSANANWHVLIEYPMYRLRQRIDTVILTERQIFVLEFKTSDSNLSSSVRQVEEYCLSLCDFHEKSRENRLVPVVVTLGSKHKGQKLPRIFASRLKDYELIDPPSVRGADGLSSFLLESVSKRTDSERPLINPKAWDNASYKPRLSIIEAAESLYTRQSVPEMNTPRASEETIDDAIKALFKIIERARKENLHVIAFVDGEPGAGKTLVGLNMTHLGLTVNPKINITFLSGNTPLVAVLRESLARNYVESQKITKAEAKKVTKTQIQTIMQWLKEYMQAHPSDPPYDRIVVFDEAQRAWDAEYGKKKFGRPDSEPEMIIQIMQRHKDWGLVIALIGPGQEINAGEVGIQEWMRSAAKNKWEVYTSSAIDPIFESKAKEELVELRRQKLFHSDPKLSLPVSRRAIVSPRYFDWVQSLLKGDAKEAKAIRGSLEQFPIFMCRDLEVMRDWLHERGRGSRKCGLLCSTGNGRLRAYGIGTTLSAQDLGPVPQWYLQAAEDVRSAGCLEVAATEYTSQGLELDFAGMCWGGDLYWDGSHRRWQARRFSGSIWQKPLISSERRELVLNKYRVLLTRFRRGMVIWVPRGDSEDPTRETNKFDETASFLSSCGAILLG